MSEALMQKMQHFGHSKKWLAVDLDGTLAHYDGWKGIGSIGDPIKNIAEAIKSRKEAGWGVAIFTARVSDPAEREAAEESIWAWADHHNIEIDGITCIKHKHFVEFWDDRAIQVIKNTGEFVINVKGDGSHIHEMVVAQGVENCGRFVKVDQYVRPIMEPDPLDKVRNTFEPGGNLEIPTQDELDLFNLNQVPACSLDVQVGGAHYKDMLIQPAEYCEYNNIPALESAVIKYVSRHMKKNGVQDLEKAKDLINMIIEMRYEPTGLNHLSARINSKRHNQFEKK